MFYYNYVVNVRYYYVSSLFTWLNRGVFLDQNYLTLYYKDTSSFDVKAQLRFRKLGWVRVESSNQSSWAFLTYVAYFLL